MALLHRADLVPSKLDLIGTWAPSQPWFVGDAASGFTTVANFRFDDPEGEVGVETLLVRAGAGPILQIPLTYRNAPLAGAEASLLGTMQHSVLGERWTYDATGDPVYLQTLATAALTGGRQADLLIEIDGAMTQRKPTAVVQGSGGAGAPVPVLPTVASILSRNEGASTILDADGLHIELARVPDGGEPLRSDDGDATLTGTWIDHPETAVLATVSFPAPTTPAPLRHQQGSSQEK